MPLTAFKKLFADPWSWRNSEFFKHSSILIGGTGLAHLVPFLLSPVISRLYFPEDFALLAAYTSVTVILTIVATGMYSSALMIDGSDEKAINTAAAAFVVSTFTALFSLIAVLLFRQWLAELTANARVLNWLLFLPLTVLFAGGSQTLILWNNRQKRYKLLATNRLVQLVSASVISVLLGFMGYHKAGLLIGLLLSQALAFALIFMQSLRKDSSLLNKVNIHGISASFKRHIDFPKYNMPQGFLDGLRESSILIILSNFFGAAALGAYSFAMSILSKPLQVIVQPAGQVFYEQAAGLDRQGQSLQPLALKVLALLFVVFLPLLGIILFWGDQLFVFVFGNNWAESGRFAQILIVWMLFRFLNSPLSGIPMIFNKQRVFFYFGAVNNLSLPLALFLAGYSGQTVISGLVALVIIGSLNMLAQMIWILNLNKQRNR